MACRIMIDNKQAAYANKMKAWDDLDPETREKFRAEDLDFVYEIWFQCKMLARNSNDAAFKLYKKYYYIL